MLILQVNLQMLRGNNFKKNNNKITNGALHWFSLPSRHTRIPLWSLKINSFQNNTEIIALLAGNRKVWKFNLHTCILGIKNDTMSESPWCLRTCSFWTSPWYERLILLLQVYGLSTNLCGLMALYLLWLTGCDHLKLQNG